MILFAEKAQIRLQMCSLIWAFALPIFLKEAFSLEWAHINPKVHTCFEKALDRELNFKEIVLNTFMYAIVFIKLSISQLEAVKISLLNWSFLLSLQKLLYLKLYLRGHGHTFRGDNCQNCFCFPSEKGSALKRICSMWEQILSF